MPGRSTSSHSKPVHANPHQARPAVPLHTMPHHAGGGGRGRGGAGGCGRGGSTGAAARAAPAAAGAPPPKERWKGEHSPLSHILCPDCIRLFPMSHFSPPPFPRHQHK
eukprot:gene20271-biopygen20589